jgi:hypothetical protein
MFFLQYAEAKLVEALHYQPEERVRFPVVSLEFLIYIILSAAIWPSDRHRTGRKVVPEILPEGKGDWCLVLTTSPLSFADCLEFKLPEHYGSVIGMYRVCLTLISPVRLASLRPVFSKLAI